MKIEIKIEEKEIIEQLYNSATNDDLFDFIKALDARVAEYDFTNRLKEYFVKEIEKEIELDEQGIGLK